MVRRKGHPRPGRQHKSELRWGNEGDIGGECGICGEQSRGPGCMDAWSGNI